jgi:5-methylcytosine-specific restriction endonuclease McrA
MDHRLPLARGGRHEIENVIPACKSCNSRKHTRTEEEFRAFLHREDEGGVGEDEAPYLVSQLAWSTWMSENATSMFVALTR